MTEPVVTQKKPFKMDLEPGEYWWCACGRSSKQPFCDGSHKGTEITPQKLSVTEKGMVWLCGCRHSKRTPYCDGAHNTIED